MTAQLAADSDALDRWTAVADSVRSTAKRLQKLAALVEYFPTLSDDALAIAARFFSGIVFPRHDARTTQVGGSILWNALASLTGGATPMSTSVSGDTKSRSRIPMTDTASAT